jgi:hypothetical protein
MTRRVLVAALAASIVLPGTAAAQLAAETGPAPRFRITPFVGYMPAFDRAEEWSFDNNNTTIFRHAELRIGGGETVGLHFEGPLRGVFGVSAAAGFARRSNTSFVVTESGDTWRMDGSNVFFGRVGPVYHMPTEQSEFVLRRLGASAFAGVVVMHDRARNTHGTADYMGSGTHLGANLGVSAELPFAQDRFAVQVGIEDNMMFWNRTHLARLPYEYFGQPGQSRQQTAVSTSMSHVWLLRAGLSYRMR